MKNITAYFTVVVVLAFIIAGCGHSGGQIGVPGTIGEVPLSSATDSNGVSLEGATVDPTKEIIINFDYAVSSVIAYLECDGDAVDLDVIPASATQFGLLPTVGRYPQKTDCELRVAAIGSGASLDSTSSTTEALANVTKQDATFNIINFSVACDYIDLFGNGKTIDFNAEATTYGNGCFKYYGTNSAADAFEMVGGFLHIKNLAGVPLAVEGLYKRISGSDYTATLGLTDVAYNYTMGGETENLIIALLISTDITKFSVEPPSSPGAFVGYQVQWDHDPGELRFICTTGASASAELTQVSDCGGGSDIPYIGFINKDSKITPFYSFDGGVTKKFFSLQVIHDTGYDMSEAFSGFSDLDVVILVFAENITFLGEAFIDSFWVDGDAGFVE